jgi:CheY-like chemotaxis protein
MTDPTRTPLSILTLDDEALILLSIEGTLIEAGYEVATATTAEQALALLDSIQFSAALIDVGLRGGDSFPVADVLMLRKIPFVFCTGSDHVKIGERFMDVPTISKPFTDQLLLDTIDQVLQPA